MADVVGAPVEKKSFLARENLGERALVMGDILRARLRQELSGYEMVRDVRIPRALP